MSAIVEVKYFNSFWIKKIEKTASSTPTESIPVWPGLEWNPYGYPVFPCEGAENTTPPAAGNWYLEESRIKGGFNNSMVSQGPRAYANEENPVQDIRSASLIYSGVYNSRTDINRTNVFSTNEEITRSSDPSFGSIQKLFAEDNNLLVFQENKINKALIDKDAIYSAEGGGTVTTSNRVVGELVPYLGRYGIGKNPESFAQFGFRKYFVDPNRGTVMRLSRDGLTEVSKYGMKDFFRDNLTAINSNYFTKNIQFKIVPQLYGEPVFVFEIEDIDACNVFVGSKVFNLTTNGEIQATGAIVLKVVPLATFPETYEITVDKPITPLTKGIFSFDCKSKITGSWDNFNKYYTVSIQADPSYVDNEINYSTLSFDEGVNGWVSFYSYKPSFAFSLKGKYYSTQDNKLYEHYADNVGSNNFGVFYGQKAPSIIEFVVNVQPSMKKVFTTINYEGDNGWQVDRIISSPTRVDKSPNEISADASGVIYSYNEGLYTDYDGYPTRCGFDRKENLYVASIKNTTIFFNDQVLPSTTISGLKGYYLDVILSTDQTTDPQGSKELWAVGTKFNQSS